MAADPLLNITYNCIYRDRLGVITLDVTLDGVSLSSTFTGDATITLDELVVGGWGVEPFFTEDLGPITLTLSLSGEGISNAQKSNWIKWSNIGDATFDIDSMNVAGDRPMKWGGFVYAIKQLGNGAVVYGSGGVSLMYPVDAPAVSFGFKDINGVGLLSKDSVCGTSSVHYFIAKDGRLYQMEEEKGLKLLDYSEYFEGLVNPEMFYDEYQQRVLIGDDSIGYVLTSSGLGGGYSSLTGYAYVDRVLTIASPEELQHRALEFTTNIIDFKHRGLKSIENVQVGTDTNEELYVAYDYRFSKDEDFRSTMWSRLNREGVGHLRASGVEFRVKIKSLLAHEFDVDYLSIQFKNIDRRFTRGPRESVG